MLEFVRFNKAYFDLPVLLGLVILIAITEFTMVKTWRTQRGRRVWAAIIGCVSLVACFILVKALLLPPFRNPS